MVRCISDATRGRATLAARSGAFTVAACSVAMEGSGRLVSPSLGWAGAPVSAPTPSTPAEAGREPSFITPAFATRA